MTVASVALSLTGSGHLLVYQLGVCRILSKSAYLKIHQVAGSSGGAIVAALLAYDLDVDDFAQEFFKTRGDGLRLLQQRLQGKTNLSRCPMLSICTTKCRDGQVHMFDFPSGSSSLNPRLLSAIEASCRIPGSFHPWDILSSSKSYPDTEGVGIDKGNYYVDGGIAAPAPPTVPNLRRVVVSPILGGGTSSKNKNDTTVEDWRISPHKSTTTTSVGSRLWSQSWFSLSLKHNFQADASIQNLHSLRAAIGMTTASELRDWYRRGQDDALRFEQKMFQ